MQMPFLGWAPECRPSPEPPFGLVFSSNFPHHDYGQEREQGGLQGAGALTPSPHWVREVQEGRVLSTQPPGSKDWASDALQGAEQLTRAHCIVHVGEPLPLLGLGFPICRTRRPKRTLNPL